MPLTELDELNEAPVPPQIPRMAGGPAKSISNHVPVQRSEPKEFEPRPGDSGDDRPTQVPRQLQPLTDADLKALANAEERLLQQELREAEELIASEPSLFGLRSYWSHPLMGATVVGLAAVLGLFVFNQVMQALSIIATLQGAWMLAAYVGLGLLGMAVLYSMLRLVWLYMRLRRNRQLRIKGLEELEKRTKLRWLVNAKLKEAKMLLHGYLMEFPLKPGRERKRLTALGLSEDTLSNLLQTRERLLDPNRWPSDDVWFAEFRDSFQSHLDQAASARINYWARRTAVGTAVSPNTLTDTAMTLYFSFTMLGDLCQIYNLRGPGRHGRHARPRVLQCLSRRPNPRNGTHDGRADSEFRRPAYPGIRNTVGQSVRQDGRESKHRGR